MTTYHLDLDGIVIEVQRKRVKNITLRIYPPDGQVRMSVPLRLSMRQIRSQIEIKREWIQQQQQRIQALPIHKEPSMQTGECHDFLGQSYILNITETTTRPRVELHGNILNMTIKPQATDLEKRTLLETWYRAQMTAMLPDLIKKWQAIIGVEVAQWGIKAMKTRWGSCNTRAHRIWLNLALIKKPISSLESVIVHELVHLLEASHNARFYALMDQFMPDWRIAKQALNKK